MDPWAPGRMMKWGWKPGIRIAGWQSWKGRWAETGWTSFPQSPESGEEEKGGRLSGQHLCLRQPSSGSSLQGPASHTPTQGSTVEGSPRSWCHSGSDRPLGLQGLMCAMYLVHSRCLTSGREAPWSVYPESFWAPPAIWQAVCVAQPVVLIQFCWAKAWSWEFSCTSALKQ